ncbi:MAG: hypothetical protein WD490_09720 [Opitutales bacterium]
MKFAPIRYCLKFKVRVRIPTSIEIEIEGAKKRKEKKSKEFSPPARSSLERGGHRERGSKEKSLTAKFSIAPQRLRKAKNFHHP